MLDKLTILEYAQKGAIAEYEKACMIQALLDTKKTHAMVEDAWGTAKEITRLMEVEQKKQDEYRKQAERDAEEAAQKRTVSAGRFVAPKQPSEVQPTENNNLWIVSISYVNGTHTVTEYEDERVAKQCYEVIQFMDKKRKNSALVRMALIHNDRTVKSYDRD